MWLIRLAVKNPLIIHMITVLVIIFGIFSALAMNREAFPSVNFDYVAVSTVYPGASPSEVELYVVNPLEQEIASVSGITELKSTSIEGSGVIVAKLDTDATKDDKQQAVDEIIRAVQRVKDLPDDLPNPPVVTEIKSDKWPIIQLALYSDTLDLLEIDSHAKNIIRRIESIKDVSHVEYLGKRLREYWVEVDPKKAQNLQVSLGAIIAALRARNINLPGGTIQTKKGEYLVRTVAAVDQENDISNIIIRSNDSGKIVRVGDVAKIRQSLEDPRYLYKANSESAILLQVMKSKNGDVIRLVDEVKKLTSEYLESGNNSEIKVSYVNDFSLFVRNRLGVLTNNGLFGILFVALILIFILSPGIAFVTALGMPVAFVGAVVYMDHSGMTVNLLSMFGMIIVLGILVDDAIIVGENIWYYYERGMSPFDATIKGTSEVIIPVSATIATTIAAFSPLLMMTGVFGQFIAEMPRVVIAALVASWIEAMLILPLHAFDVMRFADWRRQKFGSKNNQNLARVHKPGFIANVIMGFYKFILTWALKLRYLCLVAITVALFGTLYFAKNHIPLVLFPPDGVEQFFVRADLPIGTSIEETLETMKKVEEIVSKIPSEELVDFVTTVGIQQNDANDPFTARGKHLGEIKVYLSPENKRIRSADDILEEIRVQTQAIQDQTKIEKFRFERVKNGPPQGKAIAIRVSAADFELADSYAQKISEKLQSIDGVIDIDSTYKKNRGELIVRIDEEKAARSLLTIDVIASHIRMALDGTIASYVRTSEDRQALRVRLATSSAQSFQSLENITVPNQMGNLIRLSSVARFEEQLGVSTISHTERRRSITVSADVDLKVSTSTVVNNQLMPFVNELLRENSNIDIVQGGEFEDTNDSLKSLQRASIVAIVAIFFILITLFKNFTQPIVVMSAIPFAIIGVIWSLYFHGLPISFLSLIGTIGLFGVVVNDSIVLVDYMNSLVASGQTEREAIFDASIRRFRPVWLTTLTTVAGLLPMVYGIGGFDKFLQPAAISLGFGLLFGTVLILILIPVFCLIRSDIFRMLRRVSKLYN